MNHFNSICIGKGLMVIIVIAIYNRLFQFMKILFFNKDRGKTRLKCGEE